MSWRERTSSLLDLEGSVTLQQAQGQVPTNLPLSPLGEGQGEIPPPYPPSPSGMTSAQDSSIFATIARGGSAMESSGSASPGSSVGLGMGLLRVPRSPSFPPLYGTGRSYNIRIGDEQQILAKFTPRTSLPVFHPGDSVSGVLSFPPASQSKKPLKKHWRCLEVSVQLETHESSSDRLSSSRNNSQNDLFDTSPSVASSSPAPFQLDSASSSSSPLLSSKGEGRGATSVVVRMEYHEVVLDLLSTHFLFTVPADAPLSLTNHPSKTVQWVLHFEFVAVAIPRREPKSKQGAKARGQHLGTISEGQGESEGERERGGEESEDGDESDEDDEGLLQLLVEHQHQSNARGLQAEKAEWSMPITVQALPLSKRCS